MRRRPGSSCWGWRCPLRSGHGGPGRVVVVFQPHRFTRTHDLLDDFGPALGLADVVVLTDIYSAGEPPMPGVTIDRLEEAVRRSAEDVHVVHAINDLPGFVAGLARPGDLIVTLGAGSISSVAGKIVDAIAAKKAVTS